MKIIITVDINKKLMDYFHILYLKFGAHIFFK